MSGQPGLWPDASKAAEEVRTTYNHWRGKVTEGSLSLSLAIIAGNWAVFQQTGALLKNKWAIWSVLSALLTVALSLVGAWWLAWLAQRRCDHIEENSQRWEDEFKANSGLVTPWPFTRLSIWVAEGLHQLRTWLPVLGGALLVAAAAAARETPASPTASSPSCIPVPCAAVPCTAVQCAPAPQNAPPPPTLAPAAAPQAPVKNGQPAKRTTKRRRGH